jgi:anti-anti-sigma factor
VGDNFAVIRPENRLVGDKETDEFQAVVKQLNEDGLAYMVVDLGSIDWISSPGIGALVDAHQRFAKRGAHVLLARVDKRIHNLLIITKLSLVFDTFASVDEALEAGAKKPVKAPEAPTA